MFFWCFIFLLSNLPPWTETSAYSQPTTQDPALVLCKQGSHGYRCSYSQLWGGAHQEQLCFSSGSAWISIHPSVCSLRAPSLSASLPCAPAPRRYPGGRNTHHPPTPSPQSQIQKSIFTCTCTAQLIVEYSSNHWLDHDQISNISICDHNKVYKCITWRWPPMEDDLNWKTPQNIYSGISQPALIISCSIFLLKIMWL